MFAQKVRGQCRKAEAEFLSNHQHFSYVVAAEKELDGRVFAEEIFHMPAVEDALQFVGAGGLQFQSVLGSDVVAIKRSVGTGVLGVEEGQHDSARFHGDLDALDQGLHQRLGQEIREVPKHDRIEVPSREGEVFMQKALDIEGGAAIAIGDDEGFVAGSAEHVFLVKPMSQAGHEGDAGGRCRAQVEDLEAFFARNRPDEFAEAGGATAQALPGDIFVIRALPDRATE